MFEVLAGARHGNEKCNDPPNKKKTNSRSGDFLGDQLGSFPHTLSHRQNRSLIAL